LLPIIAAEEVFRTYWIIKVRRDLYLAMGTEIAFLTEMRG
jgi:hypothetical protein